MSKNLIDYKESEFEDFAALFGPGEVPGYLSHEDMQALEELCALLPKSGTLVEVGSFLGKSAVEFSKNFEKLQKNYTIICIDSFNAPIGVLERLLREADFEVPAGKIDNLDMFKYYTQNQKNIFPVTGFFNEKFVFPSKVEAVFEDSTHTLSYLNYALPFWWEHISSGGILSGHDYGGEVRTAVDIFAAIRRLPVHTFQDKQSSIWYIRKS